MMWMKIARALVWAAGLLTIFVLTNQSFADDCSFSRGNVEAYKANCQGIDGCANLRQMQALVAEDCGDSQGPPPAQAPRVKVTAAPPPVLHHDITLSPDDIKGLQAGLKILGMMVTVDGKMGPGTRQAIAQIQRAAGISPSGDIDQATFDAITALVKKIEDDKRAAETVSPFCDALAALQKVDFEAEWKAVIARDNSLKELHDDIAKLRDELDSDRLLNAGRWREATSLLLSTAATVGDLVGNLVGFNPIAAVPAAAARTAKKWGERFTQAVKGGEWGNKFRKGEIEELEYDILFEFGATRHPLILATKTTYEFARDLSELAAQPEEFESMRKDMDQSIDRLNQQLADIEQRLSNTQRWMELRDQQLAAAQQGCADEKKGVSVESP